MTALAALLAVLAVLLALPSRPRRRRSWVQVVGDGGAAGPTRGRAAGLPVPLLLALALPAAPATVLLLAGPRAAVLVAATVVVLATVARLLRLRGRRTAAARAHQAVAEACGVLTGNLRVGMVPAQALSAAAGSCPVLTEGQRTLALGGDAAEVWQRQADQPGLDGLRDLARAWRVGTRSGASLTGTLEQVAAGLAADLSLRAVVDSELAAPRATGKVMAALPVLGIGMGYLLGGRPLHWLTGAPVGWACLLVGVGLACAGVLWIEALARRAAARG